MIEAQTGLDTEKLQRCGRIRCISYAVEGSRSTAGRVFSSLTPAPYILLCLAFDLRQIRTVQTGRHPSQLAIRRAAADWIPTLRDGGGFHEYHQSTGSSVASSASPDSGWPSDPTPTSATSHPRLCLASSTAARKPRETTSSICPEEPKRAAYDRPFPFIPAHL
jgi:hypothetical protein